MASRKSIYLSDQTEKILGEPWSLSGRINSIVIRYGGIIDRDCPEFAEPEWSAMMDVLNGVHMMAEHTDTDPARYIWAEIMDGDRLNGLGEKWEIDAEALARRVRDLPYSGQVCIVEVASRFWQSPRLNELSTLDLLRECGAKITEGE